MHPQPKNTSIKKYPAPVISIKPYLEQKRSLLRKINSNDDQGAKTHLFYTGPIFKARKHDPL